MSPTVRNTPAVTLDAPPRVASLPVCGTGDFAYVPDPRWSQVPRDLALVEVTAVATDADGRVYAFNRGPHPVVVLESDGSVVGTWGEGVFARPHGITIDRAGHVWCTDDLDHCVRKFTRDGELLLTLGTPGVCSDTGATSVDYREVRRSAGPFNFPTNVAVAADGEIFVADGYGNARVHVFAPDGRLVRSWGEPGRGLGQFRAPHGIAIDEEGLVYVADRENSRIQRFTRAGDLVDTWTDVARPCQVRLDAEGVVYVAELGFRAGLFPGDVPGPGQTTGGRVSLFSRAGDLLARWGGGDEPCRPGDFFAPHDIEVDTRGDIYVSEVVHTAGIRRGVIGEDAHTLQKFVRVHALEAARTVVPRGAPSMSSHSSPSFPAASPAGDRRERMNPITGPGQPLGPGVVLHGLVGAECGAVDLATGIATIAAGAGLPGHTHPCTEAMVVLEGDVIATVQGRRYRLRQYDALHVPAGVPHAVDNPGRAPARVFAAFASGSPGRDLVALPPGAVECVAPPPDAPERLARFDGAARYDLADGADFRDLFQGFPGCEGICGGYALFQPGKSLPCHTHDYDESISIIVGEAVCQVAGSEYTLSGCATALVPRGRPHRFVNRSDRPMAMIWVYAGNMPDRVIVEQCLCDGSCGPGSSS